MLFNRWIQTLGIGIGISLLAGCERIEPKIRLHGISEKAVSLDISNLGFKSGDKLKSYVQVLDNHRHMIADICFEEGCEVVEATLYIKNQSNQPMPPPVIRMPSPPGWQKRLPLALEQTEIRPLETAKLKWIFARPKQEHQPVIEISTSVLIDVHSSTQTGS